MKNKILGSLMLLFGLLFLSIFIGALIKGFPALSLENEGTGTNIGYLIGLFAGFFMAGLAIFVLFRNGIRYLKK